MVHEKLVNAVVLMVSYPEKLGCQDLQDEPHTVARFTRVYLENQITYGCLRTGLVRLFKNIYFAMDGFT